MSGSRPRYVTLDQLEALFEPSAVITIDALRAKLRRDDEKVVTDLVRTQPSRRRKAHTAPAGAIVAAREMGVQYRGDCGRWLRPGKNG